MINYAITNPSWRNNMKFYGRKEEKKKFEAFLNRDDFQAAILYGRRRVGKTALIQECLKGRKDSFLYEWSNGRIL